MSFISITSKEIILQCIPQRNPIVMVDQLLDYNFESLVARYKVIESGLFTDNKNLMDVGLIEHMAQSIALHTGYGYYIRKIPAPMGYIGSISNLKIFRLPKINDSIVTEIHIIQEFSSILLVDVISRINNIIIATAQMKTVVARGKE